MLVKSGTYFVYGVMKIFLLLLTFLLSSCSMPEIGNIVNSFVSGDRIIPAMTRCDVLSRDRIRISFSEEISVNEVKINGSAPAWHLEDPSTVLITCHEKLSVSEPCDLFIRVSDKAYNSTAVRMKLYGRNEEIPELYINEFSSRGTETQPDRIELEVHTKGNTEGLCVMDGTKGYENHSYILPSIDVKVGDYIVIFWDAEGEDEITVNEDGSRVINLYAHSNETLASNNGVFVLYDTASGNGEILDAFVYTNGETTSYSGFGSRQVEASYNQLRNEFAWLSDAFNSKEATSTRSVCRRLGSHDTNTKTDFYICTTRGETFGYPNTSGEYVPQ